MRCSMTSPTVGHDAWTCAQVNVLELGFGPGWGLRTIAARTAVPGCTALTSGAGCPTSQAYQ